MDHFRLQTVPIFLVSIFLFATNINCQCSETIPPFGATLNDSAKTEANYLTVENIFNQKSEIKPGDLMECEVTKTKKLDANNSDIHVFQQPGLGPAYYILYPVAKDKKCFSFEVRAQYINIVFSLSTTYADPTNMYIILISSGVSLFQAKGSIVNKSTAVDIINDKELRGFWTRWLDDQLLEVGRDTDDYPILSYRLPEKFAFNFIGTASNTIPGEWVIHREPKCGPYNVTEKTIAETKCKILAKSNLQKNNFLQKLQTHIFNQIKNEHDIFKQSSFRSKEMLLEYQQLIRKHFRNAEENQNKIYTADNEIYCPLKAKTFNEITKAYFEFLEELQMELSVFKDTSSEYLMKNCSMCCGCGCNYVKH